MRSVCVLSVMVWVPVVLLRAAAGEPPRCRPGFFRCKGDSECVLYDHVCDGEEDCPDGSDEQDCTSECSKGQFRCAHGKLCIKQSEVCDGVVQCQDRSDEADCFKVDEDCGHRCGKRCLPRSFVCDGQADCEDGSDEAHCAASRPPLLCRVGSRPCRDGSECVLFGHVCDCEKDCSDGSDEDECAQEECELGDKPDEGEEEEAASTATAAKIDYPAGRPPLRCHIGSRPCRDGSECVLFGHVCDGEEDCPDGSDEQDCTSECSKGQFRCAHGKLCIKQSEVCDGVVQCQDRSDEADCFKVDEDCGHRCGKRCLPRSFVCDGQADCEDGSDEAHCAASRPPLLCRVGSRPCRDGSECVLFGHVCDCEKDCKDGSDEDECAQEECELGDKPDEGEEEEEVASTATAAKIDYPAGRPPLRCHIGSRPCRDGSECVLFGHVCDGEKDCKDGSDEDECAQDCERGQFQCAHGKLCIKQSEVCDGVVQCQDRSDELDCFTPEEGCGHRCGKRCFPESFVCDGQADCEDGSDEAHCGDAICSSGEFQCSSGQCVPVGVRCDGHPDCKDRSDEQNCSDWVDCSETDCTESAVQCGEYQWQCKLQKQCVPQSWRCDGDKDCVDESDEAECQPVSCPPHQFQCGSSACVDPSLLCDGNPDCVDGSDEGGVCLTDKCTDRSRCAQDCYSTPTGTRCWCREGYRPVDGAGCVDVDECVETPAVCAHSCMNSNGSFVCTCDQGYVLEADGRSCEVAGEPLLLASVQSELLLQDLGTSGLDVLSSGTRPIFSVDYDWLERRAYWADEEAVKWVALDKESRGTLIQGVRVGCLALDWVGRSLYWTDGVDGQINAVGLAGSEPVVIVEVDVEEPRSLALLPQKGLMFWSEAGDEAQIERAGMDGSDRRVLVWESLRWPVGLAVDLLKERLYWTDEKLHCIGSATLDGHDVKILQLVDSPSPFSLSVLGDMMYWSDARKGTVQRARKTTGKRREVLLGRPGQILGLKVVHQLMQPSAENPCVSTPCSHLCVLTPGPKGACKCPSGRGLGEDGLTCSEPSDSAFLLLLLSPTAITQVPLRSRNAAVGLRDWPTHQRIRLPGVKELRALDLVVQDQALYAWDAGRSTLGLFRVKDAAASPRGTLFSLLKNTLSAMAVDWVTLNLYWGSSGQPGLRVTSPKGSRTALLLQDEVGNVSSIALQPAAGRMCYTNGARLGKTGLECAHMDGQNRVVVWADAVRPVSLSLSSGGDVLYWADTSLGVVASVGIDGSGYKEVRTEEGLVSFALADKVLVWLTRKDSTKCWFSDDQQRATLWFEVKAELVEVKAFGKHSQRGVNSCSISNGGCAQLCLPSPGGRTCVCGRGFLTAGETNCVPDPRCPPGTRQCVIGTECVPQEKFCDGRPDCADHSDEICTPDEATSFDGSKANISSSGGPPSVRPRTFGDTVLGKNLHSDRNASPSPKPPAPPSPPSLGNDVLVKSQDPGVVPTGLLDSDSEVKVEGVDAASCSVRLCSGNGECVLRDGGTVCQCGSGYSGPSCEETLGGVIQGPVIYAAGGLCVAVIVLGVTVGIVRKRKAASRRQAGSRETRMQDLEKTVESTPAQTNGRDSEHTEDVASPAD